VSDVHVDSHLPVVHHGGAPWWDVPRLSNAISYFFATKTKTLKNCIFPFEFYDFKICVDTFYIKNFLIRLRMQKLWLFYQDIIFFVKNIKNEVYYFL
jgi:hypothetical protein